ncbi:ergosterol biosynthesis protein [Ptychographa xylographoides]|nr:ergosterol biosynthesis protein [Ptychographa xylographoides]
MASYLPAYGGILPYWLLIVSAISVGNTIQTFTSIHFTKRVYSGCTNGLRQPGSKTPPATNYPVTPLHARTFGVWSLVTCIVRIYAAYNISNPALYQLTLWTYIVGIAHFTSEWLVFGTAEWGMPLASPVVVAGGSLIWMLAQWGYYIQ